MTFGTSFEKVSLTYLTERDRQADRKTDSKTERARDMER